MPDNGASQNPLTDPVESWFTQARSQGDQSFPDQLGRVALSLGQGAYDLGKRIVSTPHDVMVGKYAPGSLEPVASQYGVDLATAGLIPELGGGEFDPNRLNLFSGWHGTPHRYAEAADNPLGEFLNEKIGTGEGAQAYAWGHYIAGAEKTGTTYRKEISADYGLPSTVHFNDEPIFSASRRGSDVEFHDGFSSLPLEGQDAMEAVAHALTRGNNDFIGEALDGLGDLQADRLSAMRDAQDADEPGAAKVFEESAARHGAAFDWLRKNETKFRTEDPGYLLNVHVRPDEHELLDWDAQLHEMDQGLQEKLGNLGFEPGNPEDIDRVERLYSLENHFWSKGIQSLHPDYVNELVNNKDALAKVNAPLIKAGETPVMLDDLKDYQSIHKWLEDLSDSGEHIHQSPTGEEIYLQLAQNRGPRGASEFLAQNGIPGVRYLDATSRRKGEGTSNYVIFDPKDIWITARNGQRLFPVDHNPWGYAPPPERPAGEDQ